MTTSQKLAALEQHFNDHELLKRKLDALRRPDGQTISKRMAVCIDELYKEIKNGNT